MLKLNDLQPAAGARKNRKRLGRGTGSGTGSTAGKGNNGAKARTGARNKYYFEGGQTPLTRRLPKRGFNNIFRTEYQIVNISDLEKIENTEQEIGVEFLHQNGLVHEVDRPVKILGNGELTKKLSVKVHAYSKTAREKIEKAKGKAEVIGCA
ncbi:MAG: 50S ribosomal protein L15 [Chitinispirillaceae bacterium]|nr:50S ribosomal protein L15 [Chitinispirillaceae bacterium]